MMAQKKAEPMELVLKVTVEAGNFDYQTLLWVEELKDKAREQGAVVSCVLSGMPDRIDFGA